MATAFGRKLTKRDFALAVVIKPGEKMLKVEIVKQRIEEQKQYIKFNELDRKEIMCIGEFDIALQGLNKDAITLFEFIKYWDNFYTTRTARKRLDALVKAGLLETFFDGKETKFRLKRVK